MRVLSANGERAWFLVNRSANPTSAMACVWRIWNDSGDAELSTICSRVTSRASVGRLSIGIARASILRKRLHWLPTAQAEENVMNRHVRDSRAHRDRASAKGTNRENTRRRVNAAVKRNPLSVVATIALVVIAGALVWPYLRPLFTALSAPIRSMLPAPCRFLVNVSAVEVRSAHGRVAAGLLRRLPATRY